MQRPNWSTSHLRAHFVNGVLSDLFSHDIDELLPVWSEFARPPSFTEVAYKDSVPWLKNHSSASFVVLCLPF